MAPVSFPLRSHERDRQVDRERFAKLSELVNVLCDELAYEAASLLERHAEMMVSSGLPLPDFEDAGNALIPEDENAQAIMRRFKLLEAQLKFLEGIERQLAQFRASLEKGVSPAAR